MPSAQSAKQSAQQAAPQTAGEALAYCTSCKMDLAHMVVAMKGDRIAKVQCKTCKKDHNYKAPKGITEPPAQRRARTKREQAASEAAKHIEIEWEKLMNAQKDKRGKAYSPKAGFILGDKVSHSKFGDGIVNRLIYPNKVEVLFRTDLKVLIHKGL